MRELAGEAKGISEGVKENHEKVFQLDESARPWGSKVLSWEMEIR